MFKRLHLAFFLLCIGMIGCTHQASSPVSLPQESLTFSSEITSLKAPKKIALFLPLNGAHAIAGQTIRDGFLMAYYKAPDFNKPKIAIYDTSNQGIPELSQKAIQEGADLIVGPLSKKEVQILAKMDTLTVPVLALNTTPSVPTNQSFFQFALAPEDEAFEVARLAHSKGHKSALIISTRNEWGTRVVETFKSAWLNQGNQIQAIVWLDQKSDIKSIIKTILQKSETLSSPTPNFDMIFMPLPHSLARTVRPLLHTDMTKHIPLYATSHIYEGRHNPGQDLDLEGIQFCDMPWILDRSPPLETIRQEVNTVWTKATDTPRLFAFGMDAYLLAQKLPTLLEEPLTLSGMTGRLSLGEHQHIQRHLLWAKMTNGIPVIQTIPSSSMPHIQGQ